MLKLEEDYIQKQCSDIIALKPDLVLTEKGVSGREMCVLVLVVVEFYTRAQSLERVAWGYRVNLSQLTIKILVLSLSNLLVIGGGRNQADG